MTVPLVSVLVPLFNGADFVQKALDSILSQTFHDFEIIVIDDGSVDEGPTIVASIDDPRIRLVRQGNCGVAAALNHAISLARGRYLARQDHDDLSAPTRLDKQVTFLNCHPDVALLGTRAEIWIDDRPDGRYHDHPCDDAALRFELLFNTPFVHSSVMMRAEAVRGVGGYTTDPAQDFDLWSRLVRRHRIANLSERLVIYREVAQSVCRTNDSQKRSARVALICAENLAFATGRTIQDPIVMSVAALQHGATHMCSPSVRLSEMRALVREAAAPILKAAPHSDVAERCARILRMQYYNWVKYRYRWMVPALRAARRISGFMDK